MRPLLLLAIVVLGLAGCMAHGIPPPELEYGQHIDYGARVVRFDEKDLDIDELQQKIVAETRAHTFAQARVCYDKRSEKRETVEVKPRGFSPRQTTSFSQSAYFTLSEEQGPRLFFPARHPQVERSLPDGYAEPKVFKMPKVASAQGKRVFFPWESNGHTPRNYWTLSTPEADVQNEYPYSAIVAIYTFDQFDRLVVCTGTVVGESTVVTAATCVFDPKTPPLILVGLHGNTYREAFVANQVWIPSNYDPCLLRTTNIPVGDSRDVPVPSEGSWALLHIAKKPLDDGSYLEIGEITGALALGAIYLPDLATFVGYDVARSDTNLNVLDANVKTLFNTQSELQNTGLPDSPHDTTQAGFHDDFFNVEGDFEVRGAPAIVNFGPAHWEDLNPKKDDPEFWHKHRNVVAGVASDFSSDSTIFWPHLDGGASGEVVSTSGSFFGSDFVSFLFSYCSAVCEISCDVDHACGNGRVDVATGSCHIANDFYPPWWLPEACDNGWKLNSDRPNSACRSDCTLARCGDGIVDDEPEDGRTAEECDPPSATCDASCQSI